MRGDCTSNFRSRDFNNTIRTRTEREDGEAHLCMGGTLWRKAVESDARRQDNDEANDGHQDRQRLNDLVGFKPNGYWQVLAVLHEDGADRRQATL